MVNKQKFKGKILFRQRVINNILKVYNDDRFDFDGDWYKMANHLSNSLADEFGLTSLQTAGIIAALSPLKSWDENKRIARSFIKSGNGMHTKAMKNKARVIKNHSGDCPDFILTTLNGNKIKSFFKNIAFPTCPVTVTVDRHAISICLGRNIVENEGKDITYKQYDFFASCYREAGNLLGLLPSQVQSITWEKWRAAKKQRQFETVPF